MQRVCIVLISMASLFEILRGETIFLYNVLTCQGVVVFFTQGQTVSVRFSPC